MSSSDIHFQQPLLSPPLCLQSLTLTLSTCLLPTSTSSSHLLSSVAPSTPSVSLITSSPPSPSPRIYPYSQLVQYRSLRATVRQISRGGLPTLKATRYRQQSMQYSAAVRQCVFKFHWVCQRKAINWTECVTWGWKSWLKWISARELS